MSAGRVSRRLVRTGGFSFGRVCGAVLATLLCLLLPVAANAYTLVLRNGRHVNLPDGFKVTHRAVIYEASHGLTVTVWLTNVDVAATEKANAEPEGSFARRMRQEPGAALKSEGRARPNVVTNNDLEPSRLRREAQEAEYERTHRERGLPSRQELQKHFEEQDRRLHELALQIEKEQAEAELDALKSALFVVKRNLSELNLHLSQQTGAYTPAYGFPNFYPYYYAPPVQLINRFPFGHRGGFRHVNFGHQLRRPYNSRQARPFASPVAPRPNRNTPPRHPARPASRR